MIPVFDLGNKLEGKKTLTSQIKEKGGQWLGSRAVGFLLPDRS